MVAADGAGRLPPQTRRAEPRTTTEVRSCPYEWDQRLRPDGARDVPRRTRAGSRHRVGRHQRHHGRRCRGAAAGEGQRLRPLPRHGRGARRRDPRRRTRDPGLRGARPRRPAVARRGRRGRDRVERALPRACRRRPPPRRRRPQGDHLGPGEGAGRDGRARDQLRRGLRPRPPPRHLQRLLHDELPRAGGQGAARGVRDPARRDDDRPRVHGRPAAARRAAQGPAARPRRRAQPRPDHDRRRQGDRPRDPGARGPDAGLRRPRPDPHGLDGRPHDRDRAGDDRRGGQRRRARPRRLAGRLRESSSTARMRLCRPTSSDRRTRRSSTRG